MAGSMQNMSVLSQNKSSANDFEMDVEMKNPAFFILLATVLLAGCAAAPIESFEKSEEAKTFLAPPSGKAGLYIYRSSQYGYSIKRDIWLNGKCIGRSAPEVFFYQLVTSEEEYNLSTESGLGINQISFTPESGTNYFIRQDIGTGFFGETSLQLIDAQTAQREISQLDMALSGGCTQMTLNTIP